MKKRRIIQVMSES